MAARRRPAAASRILAGGIALGAFGGTIGLLSTHPPTATVREVAVPTPGPTRVVWVEVHHHPAPVAAAPPATTSGASSSVPRAASPVRTTGTAAAPSITPAPTPAPAAATAPAPVTTTKAS